MSELESTPGELVDDAPEIVTLACDTCGATVSGKPRGRGSAPFLMARHKWNVHREKSSKPARRRSSEPSDAEFAERPVLASVRSIAAEVRPGKGAPSETDLANALGRGLGYVSIAVASYAAESDPTIPDGPEGERIREWLTDYLSVTPQGARDIMRPIAKSLAPTSLNKKYGRAAVENVDVIASVAELGTLAMHWRKYFRNRRYMTAAAGVPAPASPAPMAPAAAAADTFTAPAPASSPAPAGPTVVPGAPLTGTVITPSMLGRTT